MRDLLGGEERRLTERDGRDGYAKFSPAGLKLAYHSWIDSLDHNSVELACLYVLRGSLFDDGLESVEIKLEHIEKIEAERIALGRSTAAVLGGIVLAPLAAVGAGLALAGQ